MSDSLFTLDIKDLKALFPTDRVDSLSDDFIISHLTADELLSDDRMQFLKKPFRFNGYLAYFCLGGEINLEINLQSFTVSRGTLVINTPGNICRAQSIGENKVQDVNIIIMAMSPEFLTTIRLDFNSLYRESNSILDNPCISLSQEEFEVCRMYMRIAEQLIHSGEARSRDALRYLISSVFYFLGNIWTEKISEARKSADKGSVRSKMTADSFIKLVVEHHNEERNMAFYADKLCLSPKYLSKLVKAQTGRSAPEWIDAFVIMEAKNLLKYSELSIKEIVYKLHFPNQSVFYKFFKAHTGMTPSDYRTS
jgi:AraC family transcriptional regulator, transcriptional activator of pobA